MGIPAFFSWLRQRYPAITALCPTHATASARVLTKPPSLLLSNRQQHWLETVPPPPSPQSATFLALICAAPTSFISTTPNADTSECFGGFSSGQRAPPTEVNQSNCFARTHRWGRYATTSAWDRCLLLCSPPPPRR